MKSRSKWSKRREVRISSFLRPKMLTAFLQSALLAVNKLIRAEAIPVLYGGNTWRLVHGLYTPGSCIFLEHPMAFQNINLVFDQRDLPEIKKVEVSREIHAKNFEFSHTTNISAARVRAVHSRHISLMTQLIWEKAWSLMKTLQGVKTITVDLAYFGCPSGCCRVLQMKTQTALYLVSLSKRDFLLSNIYICRNPLPRETALRIIEARLLTLPSGRP